VRPEQLALTYIERLFTAYCLAYGLTISLVPGDRVPANGMADLARSMGLSSRTVLALVFLAPGVLLLWPRLRSVGFWTAIFTIGIFEVGLVVSALSGFGTSTAPVGVLFPLAAAAVLLGSRRRSDAGRSIAGATQ
jgi:hypothetical protein